MSSNYIECPLCFETYDNDTNKPVKLFCCGVNICDSCLHAIADSSLTCPWDKKRWLKR
jgi:hypothetical protein